jgi:hypothetical protein
MANTCEPLLNVVIRNKPKVLCPSRAEGLNQKVRGPERGSFVYPAADSATTGEQAGPNPSGWMRGTWQCSQPSPRGESEP